MQMIRAEQTAMQASTVGSSLIFNKQTWRENIAVVNILPSYPGGDHMIVSHLSHVAVTVAHPHLTAAVGAAVAGWGAWKLRTTTVRV